MIARLSLALAAALALAACEAPPVDQTGAPVARAYRIGEGQAPAIQLRMLDSVNALRRSRGLPPLELNAELTAAGATHARDMSVQNRPWHFGSDGSSPVSRAARAGYAGTLLGEVLSETYETELQTLAAWMEQDDTRAVILAPGARDMGFAFYQEPNGKIWWVLNTGTRGGGPGVS